MTRAPALAAPSALSLSHSLTRGLGQPDMTSSRSSLCSPHPLRPRGESVQTEESHQEVAWAEGGWEGSVNNAVDLEWERERERERESRRWRIFKTPSFCCRVHRERESEKGVCAVIFGGLLVAAG